ncbi:protein PET54 [Metschnikowia aff. pulcherrima]|uniref:Protein PET54 n=1 Tax=Metschnikowia aff. pulcherrima TaxID=2163413 RepID=A0A4P6XNE5_9ASCO|nr:protein PET54 [Metschnikowia aff. pulcherrima]
MSRGPRTAHDRLLNLLYKKTVPEIKPRIPIVKRVLYEQDPGQFPLRSTLDGLVKYQWRQQPITTAISDVQEKFPDAVKSNVLQMSSRNAFVGSADLHNIFPIPAERRYALKNHLEKGLKFHFVKARNPISLLFLGSFYLVFPNYNQACVYYMETRNKQINGLDVNLQFVSLTENHLKRMASPFLDCPKPIESFSYQSERYGSVPITSIFSSSVHQSNLVKELDTFSDDRSKFTEEKVDPLYDLLAQYLGQSYRDRLVIVRNLPFGVTGPALESLLWDYEFENDDFPQDSITNLYSDASSQVTLALLKFKDHKNAKRFVRNYHGRRWEKVTKRKEKPLYEPILCEIAD